MDDVEFYEARDGHRWRLKGRNGKIIAESGEAYSSARSARRGFLCVLRALRPAVLAMEESP